MAQQEEEKKLLHPDTTVTTQTFTVEGRRMVITSGVPLDEYFQMISQASATPTTIDTHTLQDFEGTQSLRVYNGPHDSIVTDGKIVPFLVPGTRRLIRYDITGATYAAWRDESVTILATAFGADAVKKQARPHGVNLNVTVSGSRVIKSQ